MEIDKLEYATQLKEKLDHLIKDQRDIMNMKHQYINAKEKATEIYYESID